MVENIPLNSRPDLREQVRQRYAESARKVSVRPVNVSGCCSPSPSDPATAAAYGASELGDLPQTAVLASLGCGNPTALAELRPGETVLDLGSGGGIDVLLSAKRVGAEGFAYGLDMTDEMLELAERNRAESGVTNVQFLKGHIEEIPLPDDSVDVIISNCVINLSADKDQVLREAIRVLRPGGRFAVSDIVLTDALPVEIQNSLAAWSCCVAGALTESDYRDKLASAGFTDIDVEFTHSYEPRSLFEGSADCCGGPGMTGESYAGLEGRIHSAFIRARKPSYAGFR
jgi:arsenite methyltransferase